MDAVEMLTSYHLISRGYFSVANQFLAGKSTCQVFSPLDGSKILGVIVNEQIVSLVRDLRTSKANLSPKELVVSNYGGKSLGVALLAIIQAECMKEKFLAGRIESGKRNNVDSYNDRRLSISINKLLSRASELKMLDDESSRYHRLAFSFEVALGSELLGSRPLQNSRKIVNRNERGYPTIENQKCNIMKKRDKYCASGPNLEWAFVQAIGSLVSSRTITKQSAYSAVGNTWKFYRDVWQSNVSPAKVSSSYTIASRNESIKSIDIIRKHCNKEYCHIEIRENKRENRNCVSSLNDYKLNTCLKQIAYKMNVERFFVTSRAKEHYVKNNRSNIGTIYQEMINDRRYVYYHLQAYLKSPGTWGFTVKLRMFH